VCSLWLLCDVTVTLMLDYPGLISLFNDGIVIEEAAPVSLISANMMLVFCTGCAAFTIPFLSQKDVMNFLDRFKNSGREILTGVGLAFLLRTGFAIYQLTLSYFGFPIHAGSNVIASVSDSIVSLNEFYSPWLGFLFVVILVPFYEEILFRGVFLSACERNMKFILANALQSLVFALVHNDLKLIPFYFAFGMVAGFYRQKNQNLTTSTSMHMTNNLFAFLILMVKG
jgi:membrane protease YdiL (CAAX protease family)